MPFTEKQLNDIRGGLTAEEYRWKLIRDWLEDWSILYARRP